MSKCLGPDPDDHTPPSPRPPFSRWVRFKDLWIRGVQTPLGTALLVLGIGGFVICVQALIFEIGGCL